MLEPPRTLSNNGVSIEGVQKSFTVRRGPSVVAIDTVDAVIEPGEFVSIVGPSGCGKSTLLMCVAGLERPTRGTIRIGGQEVVGPQSDLGIVFQAAELLDWRSAIDNVLLQVECRGLKPNDYRERAEALLSGVGLGDFLDQLPHELSGGMRQRVALCRALLHDPQILLMDEPFGALDALTRDQMNTDLQRIWMETRKTALFVTHSIEEAVFLSDRVLVLGPRPGRVVLELKIELPRPRRLQDRTRPEFGKYVDRVLDVFAELGVLHVDQNSEGGDDNRSN